MISFIHGTTRGYRKTKKPHHQDELVYGKNNNKKLRRLPFLFAKNENILYLAYDQVAEISGSPKR